MRISTLAKIFLLAGGLLPMSAHAQLSGNPDKFLGNITTGWQISPQGYEFADLWNQITPENETKWGSIEGNRNSYGWGNADNIYRYSREHNFPMKFHCLIWGSQYPSWMDALAPKVQLKEIIEWMDLCAQRYPDLELIDVVNEALPGHAPAPYKEALGGDGLSGYDWIVKAFELAHERWPNAILIYNDFNTFQWNTDGFIDLVKKVRNAGAPIDAYGCQSHDLGDIQFSSFKNVMSKIQNALKMPMYSSEYDISIADDQKQLQQYKDQIKYMWERDYCAGITLWGFIYGSTWVEHSGIIKNGQDRPAMTWLREYMASEEARTAPSPYPGMKKEASIYIRPIPMVGGVGVEGDVLIDATLHNGKEIEKVEFYVNNKLAETLTEAPYVAKYTPEKLGSVNFKAIVYDAEGRTYERLGGMRAVTGRFPFYGDPFNFPCTIEAEDFDKCGEGISYHDSDSNDQGGAKYRDDNEGVDIMRANGGFAIGYTAAGEWLEYTVDVPSTGKYNVEFIVSGGADGGQFHLEYDKDGETTPLTKTIDVDNLGWDNYYSITVPFKRNLQEGKQIIRLCIDHAGLNIDKMIFTDKASSGIDDALEAQVCLYEVFTTTGVKVGTFEADGDADFGALVRQTAGHGGIYLIHNTVTNSSRLVSTK